VYVYKCRYIFIYIYVYKYIHIYKYTHIYINIHIYISISIYVCVYIYIIQFRLCLELQVEHNLQKLCFIKLPPAEINTRSLLSGFILILLFINVYVCLCLLFFLPFYFFNKHPARDVLPLNVAHWSTVQTERGHTEIIASYEWHAWWSLRRWSEPHRHVRTAVQSIRLRRLIALHKSQHIASPWGETVLQLFCSHTDISRYSRCATNAPTTVDKIRFIIF